MNAITKLITFTLFSLALFGCGGKDPMPDTKDRSNANKPRLIWIDASANFIYFANSQANIDMYLEKVKTTGFTGIIVDVRPTSGDVLYSSNIVDQQKSMNGIARTATWDYLGYFLTKGHELGLKVYASMNTFVGGSTSHGGVIYRDSQKAEWLTLMNYPAPQGISSILDDAKSNAKFFNPVNPDVQDYIRSIIREIATNYPKLDGIVLDRGRFNSIESDFSDLTRKAFEAYIGAPIANFPDDIFSYNSSGTRVEGLWFKKWLEFRAKVIYDFFKSARETVKAVDSDMAFATYTGAWYSTYYNEGVNWASQKYDPSTKYNWATPEYKNYGYAELLDFYMTGAYGTTIYGGGEWTVQGAIINAMGLVRNATPVLGSLYGLNYKDKPDEAQLATYVALTTGEGLMYFDIIYLILYNQWDNVKAGIDQAIALDKK